MEILHLTFTYRGEHCDLSTAFIARWRQDGEDFNCFISARGKLPGEYYRISLGRMLAEDDAVDLNSADAEPIRRALRREIDEGALQDARAAYQEASRSRAAKLADNVRADELATLFRLADSYGFHVNACLPVGGVREGVDRYSVGAGLTLALGAIIAERQEATADIKPGIDRATDVVLGALKSVSDWKATRGAINDHAEG